MTMTTRSTLSLALLSTLLALGSARAAPAPARASKHGAAGASPAGAVTRLSVWFKLDPRLTRGLYMGDRWVSPPRFKTPPQGKPAVVAALSEGMDAAGKRFDVAADWVPDDPGMVEIARGAAGEVSIRVKRAGRSTVRISFRDVARELVVEATEKDGTLSVQVAQERDAPGGEGAT
jgi:hypothetical protein